MKQYKAYYQIEIKLATGDVGKRDMIKTVYADSFAEARRSIKIKQQGINIRLEEVKS